MTAVCRSAVTTSRFDTALDMASSALLAPRRTRRLRTSTSSPTMFMISSSRAVSTRTVVSASLAGFSAGGAAGARAAAGAAAATGAGASAFASGALATGLGATTLAAGAATEALELFAAVAVPTSLNLPLPCSSSSRASNS
ncbi:hypothetical protein D3C76_1012480 [compost metagenome]